MIMKGSVHKSAICHELDSNSSKTQTCDLVIQNQEG